MKRSNSRVSRGLLRGVWVCLVLPAVGCGGLRLVPVSGKATVDGKPLVGAVVTFNPDASKDNKLRVSCRGRVGGDGRYELYTDDGTNVRAGAPLGWYKVTLVTDLPGAPPIQVNARYTDMDKTPLSVEVVGEPAAGTYDLKVTK